MRRFLRWPPGITRAVPKPLGIWDIAGEGGGGPALESDEILQENLFKILQENGSTIYIER